MRDFAEQGNSKCWSLMGYLALLAPLAYLELTALLHFWRIAGLRIGACALNLRIRHRQLHTCEKMWSVVICLNSWGTAACAATAAIAATKLMGDSGMCRYSGHRCYVRSHTQAIVATAANAAACVMTRKECFSRICSSSASVSVVVSILHFWTAFLCKCQCLSIASSLNLGIVVKVAARIIGIQQGLRQPQRTMNVIWVLCLCGCVHDLQQHENS